MSPNAANAANAPTVTGAKPRRLTETQEQAPTGRPQAADPAQADRARARFESAPRLRLLSILREKLCTSFSVGVGNPMASVALQPELPLRWRPSSEWFALRCSASVCESSAVRPEEERSRCSSVLFDSRACVRPGAMRSDGVVRWRRDSTPAPREERRPSGALGGGRADRQGGQHGVGGRTRAAGRGSRQLHQASPRSCTGEMSASFVFFFFSACSCAFLAFAMLSPSSPPNASANLRHTAGDYAISTRLRAPLPGRTNRTPRHPCNPSLSCPA